MQDIKDYLKTTPLFEHWNKIGIKHHHGFCLPLFSIRSKRSSGIGEFGDLTLLIDWCQKIGLDIIQLLPINEVAKNDPCPYSAISSFALDPIYLTLRDLPYLEENPLFEKQLKKLQKYNSCSRVKYSIRKNKLLFLEQYYNLFYERFANLPSYTKFLSTHAWLRPYAIFKVLKNKFKEKEWFSWPKEFKSADENTINKLFDENKKQATLYIFLQYLCFEELSKVKAYGSSKGVFLKGDLPILIKGDSADVFSYPSIFDLYNVAGAPPDDFFKKGQKWGFPLLNWDEHKKRGDFWWKERLFAIKDLYHLYRIDHAVGFYRIWAIAPDEKAINGRFLPEDTSSWQKIGEEHFKLLIEASPLLPIAEDLGTIPEFVSPSLKKLGICGTKIPRWQDIPMKDYEPLSLTTLSTPDTETLEMWWRSSPKKAKKFCAINGVEYTKRLNFELRKKILFMSHHSSSLFHINLLQEYLALFPDLVSKNPKKERINLPGIRSKKNWTYKFIPSLEELVSNEELLKTLKEIIS